MRKKTYIVKLSAENRKELEEVISSPKCGKEKRLRAYVLLKSDAKCNWSDEAIKDAYGVSLAAVGKIRKRFVEEGFDRALHRKKRLNPPIPRKIHGEEEARLIALCCSEPPEGRTRWTLRLLADKAVELEIVDDVGRECIRTSLKKINLSLG